MNMKDFAFRWYIELTAIEKLAQDCRFSDVSRRFHHLKDSIREVALGGGEKLTSQRQARGD